ncbi:MAG TPA: DNA polymerase I [Paludibacteraceae bacterium]|jgi:DNA polymerase-1|nr:DNA polymerase I [Paludibacteraceae bacterium]HOU69118.1 DNA polymerase I [Paludibacteraceae bacterium]
MEKKLFLIDAYALIYRAYYAFIKNPRVNSKGMNTSAILGFVNTLEDVLKTQSPTHIAVCFDPSGPTFRHEAYKEYKAQREVTPEDIKASIPIIKEIIKAYNIPILEVPGFEADDVVGTVSKMAEKRGYTVYMLTPDKDYAQLVSDHIFIYRPKHGGGYEVLGIDGVKQKWGLTSPEQVIDLLGLMGDASDNIPGCPGVGEKTAVKLLEEFGSIDNLIKSTDSLKGALKKKVEENVDKINFSKFLATIRLDVPIDFNDEQLLLETPDVEKLKKIFSELEFKNILSKLDPPQKVYKSDPLQPSLFEEFVDNESGEIKYSNLSDLNSTPHNYQLIDNEEKMAKFLVKISEQNFFCFDTETTGTDVFSADLVGMSFAWNEGESFYIPVPQNREEAQILVDRFKPYFENESILKIGQNLKFDLLMLKNYGVELKGKLFDTMIAHYLLQPELRHNMDYLAEIYLKYKTITYEELCGPKEKGQTPIRNVDINKLCDYAAEDADVTLKLKNILEKEIESNHLDNLFYNIEMPLMPVLAQMEFDGVRIDTESLNQFSVVMSEKLQLIEKEIFSLAGYEFNISSPKQVGELIFDRLKVVEKGRKTKTGQYSTNEEVLESLRGKHPVVDKILEYRGIKKLLSTYIDSLPTLINPRTGKIHTSYNQTVTATGRLSSSNPNLQNIPIRDEDGKEIRKAFIADEGCIFFSADYSQIELRIMAHLSQDANMLEAFNSGQDVHSATAAKIYKVDIKDVTSDMRRKAKTANFGIIYGISVFGLAERLTIPRSESKELIDGYFETYPQIKTYIDKCIQIAKEKGYVETLFGRKRFLPDINSRNSIVRGFAERNTVNAPIQGTAADIIKIAMVNIHKKFKENGLKSQMILQVHDELNFNVYQDELYMVKSIVVSEMQNAIKLSVPLIADCGVGANWLEAH